MLSIKVFQVHFTSIIIPLTSNNMYIYHNWPQKTILIENSLGLEAGLRYSAEAVGGRHAEMRDKLQ